MLYKLDLDRDCFDKKKCFIDDEKNFQCKEHGAMVCVSKFLDEKDEKTKKIYRCLDCNIGIIFDLDYSTNQKEFLK